MSDQVIPVSDIEAGFDVLDHFERFTQKNDIYSRAFWDPSVWSDRTDRFFESYRTPLKKWKKAEGFRQKDYALRNASWHLPDIFAELKEDENRREGFLDPFTVHNQSNIIGVKKWTVDAEPCFRFWANQNSDCSICVRVCPYNRELASLWGRSWRWLAGTRLRRVALWLAARFSPGDRVSPDTWWRRNVR